MRDASLTQLAVPPEEAGVCNDISRDAPSRGSVSQVSRPPPVPAVLVPPMPGGAELQAGGIRTTRSFGYGESVLRERPILLVPQRAEEFLRSAGTDAMVAVSAQLGDVERLAAFAAFQKLVAEDRERLLSMDASAGSKSVHNIMRIVGMFLKDFPQFATALDWPLFARVVAVVSDRGSRLPGGERAVYYLSDQAAHSCAPNAVFETLGADGLREVRVIAHSGISRGEDITISHVPEEVLVQPRAARRQAIKKMRCGGTFCACVRCAAGDDTEPVLELLKAVAAARGSMSEESLRAKISDMARLDTMLPFAMVGKARARAQLAEAFSELAAVGGKAGDFLFHQAAELFDVLLGEIVLVLGQKGLHKEDSIQRRLEKIREQLE